VRDEGFDCTTRRNAGAEESEIGDCLIEWKASMEGKIGLVRLSHDHDCYSNLSNQCARNNLQHRNIPETKCGGHARFERGEVAPCRIGGFDCTTQKEHGAEENEMGDCLSQWKTSMEGQIGFAHLSCGNDCYSNLTSQSARNNLQYRKIPETNCGSRERS
jgi:hypothetical protein